MRSYGVLLEWICERLNPFITNCHKVVYNKLKKKQKKTPPHHLIPTTEVVNRSPVSENYPLS